MPVCDKEPYGHQTSLPSNSNLILIDVVRSILTRDGFLDAISCTMKETNNLLGKPTLNEAVIAATKCLKVDSVPYRIVKLFARSG